MNLVRNARVTLTATILNNLAAAFAVAGLVAPAATGQPDTAGRLVVAFVWAVISAGLHPLARALPEGLE